MPSRFSLTVVVSIAAGVWAVALAANGWKIGGSFFSPASIAVSVLVVLGLVFDRWVWSWPGVNAVWHRPDLRGTWKGEIKSTFAEATAPIEAYLSIHETYSSLTVRLLTTESRSKTTIASVATDEDGTDTIVAIYRSESHLSQREKNPMHDGAFSLRLDGKDAVCGKYWTDRGTQGEMTFRRVSKKRAASFADAQTIGSAKTKNQIGPAPQIAGALPAQAGEHASVPTPQLPKEQETHSGSSA